MDSCNSILIDTYPRRRRRRKKQNKKNKKKKYICLGFEIINY